MWHDAFYTRSANDQLLEINRANANILRRKPVMNETQTRGPADNSSRVMHMAKAGRVQSVIAKLPLHLQSFGNYCWSPRVEESLPTYKHHNEIANALNQEIKATFPAEYAHYTGKISIIILNILKYEYERDKGYKPQSIDITLAGALAITKDKVKAQWSHVIKHIRNCIRDMQLDADVNHDLDIASLRLFNETLNATDKWDVLDSEKSKSQYMTLAKLAIKSFAAKDQDYLFTSSESKESVSHKKPLYTQEYLSWRIGVQSANWKRDGWDDTLDQVIDILNGWASISLQKLLQIKIQ